MLSKELRIRQLMETQLAIIQMQSHVELNTSTDPVLMRPN